MPHLGSERRAGRAGELWPVLLLFLVIALPTVGVLWFVGVAMENQRLATRQRLSDAYRSHLQNVQQQIDIQWRELADRADGWTNVDAPQRFANVVRNSLADSVVCCDSSGQVQYPTITAEADAYHPSGPHWIEAIHLETEVADPLAAEVIYASLAENGESAQERIAAIQAQVRCLLKEKRKEAAVELVSQSLRRGDFRSLRDRSARSMAANLQLMAIQQMARSDDILRIQDNLAKTVHDYGENSLGSGQRLFLMKQLRAVAPDQVDQGLLEAEELATRFVTMYPRPARRQALQRSEDLSVWHGATPSGRMILMWKQEGIVARIRRAASKTSLPLDAKILAVPPGEEPETSAFVILPAGSRLSGWRLALSLNDGSQIDMTAVQRSRLHLWSGIVLVLSTSVLALFIGRAFRRQIHLANLKNDLVGTVSHELKTPLSSMRLLVDTLLDDDHLDVDTTREYLRLIATENARLSRLIDNFLTFTRMEQQRHIFDFQHITAGEIVERSVEAAGERFHASDCTLTVQVAPHLPYINGDMDSLVTVLLNLLDNAYKYSSGRREVTLRAEYHGGKVCISVADNGFGLSRSAAKRVFQRFYQVDQSLAREGRGCGLGLSIVASIVRAHHGSIDIVSSLGKGSTFTVTLPAVARQSAATYTEDRD